MEKKQKRFWFVNNSEYHHREMGHHGNDTPNFPRAIYYISRIGYTVMTYTVRAHFYVHVWKPYKSIRLVILTTYAVCTYVVCESLGCTIFISHVQPLKKLLSLLLLYH